MLKFLILLTLMVTACGKKTVIKSVLSDEDIPDTVLTPCLKLPGLDEVDCHTWNLKKLETSHDAVETLPVDDLEQPYIILSLKDFVALKQFLFPFLKTVYRALHKYNVSPEQFDNFLDSQAQNMDT